ncbi:hypothetical protein GCM10010913_11610 [Paenibacillus aceti]|uniref:Uncharacterized protein n=1 Tax=Paenibacillus aceti TaxID=1820010 RepID=A0ABQ1VSC2_9BACL|nr:hypothetical protein GCM10010913_11610 [Paenibacillus aceti]
MICTPVRGVILKLRGRSAQCHERALAALPPTSNETPERYFPEISGKKILTNPHIVILGKSSF